MKALASFFLVLLCASVAHADPLANPDAPQSLAALWPMLAVGLANLVGVIVPRVSDELSFFHTRGGKALLTGLGAFVSAIPSAIQAHGLCWAMLAWAALGCIGTLTSAMSPQAKNAVAAIAILIGLGISLTACHGYKAPSYATLAFMSEGASAAAQATPPACETLENAAVDAAKAKDEATAKAGAIHERCGAALTVLEGVGKGIKTARDAVQAAPDDATLTEALPWIRVAVQSYCDAAKMMALFNVQLPMVAGVC